MLMEEGTKNKVEMLQLGLIEVPLLVRSFDIKTILYALLSPAMSGNTCNKCDAKRVESNNTI